MPSKFEFVGTNDSNCGKNSNWVTLCRRRVDFEESTKNRELSRGCLVNPKSIQGKSKFRRLGLKILEIENSIMANKHSCLSGIRIWEFHDLLTQ